jgi:hypothetical protein
MTKMMVFCSAFALFDEGDDVVVDFDEMHYINFAEDEGKFEEVVERHIEEHSVSHAPTIFGVMESDPRFVQFQKDDPGNIERLVNRLPEGDDEYAARLRGNSFAVNMGMYIPAREIINAYKYRLAQQTRKEVKL